MLAHTMQVDTPEQSSSPLKATHRVLASYPAMHNALVVCCCTSLPNPNLYAQLTANKFSCLSCYYQLTQQHPGTIQLPLLTILPNYLLCLQLSHSLHFNFRPVLAKFLRQLTAAIIIATTNDEASQLQQCFQQSYSYYPYNLAISGEITACLAFTWMQAVYSSC